MERRRFGKTGLELSLIGIGGIPFANLPAEDVENVISKGVDLGVNFIETARGYGSSEEKIGKAIKGKRQSLTIITKGHALGNISCLDESLKALDVDYIDVYQIHGLAPGALAKAEESGMLEQLVREKEKGKFRFLGVTAHFPEAFIEAMEYDIFTSIQAPVNFVEYERYESAVEHAAARDVGILAMKPLGGGIFPAAESLRFLLFTLVSAIPVGVKTPAEIEQNVLAVSCREPLSESEKALLSSELEKWGDNFCRKCGYCRGCPQGIATDSLMLTEILFYRDGIDAMLRMKYPEKLELSLKCTGCGQCVKKCPYSLKIPETIAGYRKKYLGLLEKVI